MIRFRILSLLFVCFFLLTTPQITYAQNYSFSIPGQTVDIYINNDGSASLEYLITFNNNPGAHEIDFVDIGLPTKDYDLNSISATISGNQITHIAKSEYVDGIELGLGMNSIQPGSSGTVFVRIGRIRGMLYTASVEEAEPYASFNFAPNFFSSEFVTGTTEMIVNMHMPPGLTNNEPRYFNPSSNWPGTDEPEGGFDSENRIVYQWYAQNASASQKYTFGGAFPARVVPSNTIKSEQSITFQPNEILSIAFPILCCGGTLGIIILIIVLSIKASQKQRLKYLPPKIAIEGHGIKRGLTAIEAAVLMEQPMDKILSMILFSTLKKEVAKLASKDPLKIEVEETIPEGLHAYEVEFLEAFKEGDTRKRRSKLQDMMVNLVKVVGEKMKGFSRNETIVYYKDIIERAWKEVESADTPEVKVERYDENMDWTMLDKEYDKRTQRTFGSGPVFMPNWWWRADPTIGRTTSTVAGTPKVSTAPSRPSGGGKSVTVTLPQLPGSQAAASVVNTVQAFSAGAVGNLLGFTSGVTNKTNPAPKTTTSSFRGGSSSGGSFSSGCACACACAGCACACAGGGR